jgi:regulator of RNase E activity RraB
MNTLEEIFKAYNEASDDVKLLFGTTLMSVLRVELDELRDKQRRKFMPIGEYREAKLSEWGFQYKDYECKNKDCKNYNEL